MKKAPKICLWCQTEFIPARSDTVYCGTSCRWEYWRNKKKENTSNPFLEDPVVMPPLTASLQGVITENKNRPLASPENIGSAVFTYPQTNPELKQLEDEKSRVLENIRACEEALNRLEMNEAPFFYILGGLAGLGLSVIKDNRLPGHILCTALGIGSGILVKNLTEDLRQDFKEKKLPELYALKNQLQGELTLIDASINQQKRLSEPTTFSGFTSLFSSKKPASPLDIVTPNAKESEIRVILPDASEKIISSEELVDMDYQALNFRGRWQSFFGFPSVNFHCVVHGMSGEGKSTFAIQFANYLAENFGTVLYVSGEEGFSKTFKDKFLNNDACSKRLFVADLRTYQDVVEQVKDDQFNFIFIDSLDNMKIDADLMKKLRSRYKDSALVTISQSTKDGKMRGSYEIVHDSDMAVKVENGVARTTKNRFKEKDMEFEVFDRFRDAA